ncbi:MAG: hypothetical protein IPK04_01300 [Bdellovibrionales bacterium]|nr:hypothetical protein [Bdellovibrionales bacterium]
MRKKLSHQIIVNLALLLIACRIVLMLTQVYNENDTFIIQRTEALKQTLAILVDSDLRKPLAAEELEQRLIIAYKANLFDFYKVEVPNIGADPDSNVGSKTLFQTANITNLETQDLKPAVLYTSNDFTVLKNQLNIFQ